MELQSSYGLSVEFLENGAVKSINADPIRISLKAGTLFSFPGTNIFLRTRKDQIAFHPLTGPGSLSKFHIIENEYVATGEWSGIQYACSLQLAANSPGWQWIIDLKNTLANPVELDLVYVQDVGLKPIDAGLINEYYVAQYLERRILEDETHGAVICCRQNMKEPTGHPWIMIACKNGAASASTDGMQFFGRSHRETGIPEGLETETFGGEYAGESSVVALQEKPFSLAPGDIHQTIFAGYFMPDHPQATSSEDLRLLQEIDAITLTPVLPSFRPPVLPSYSLTVLSVDDLNNVELDRFFGTDRRHAEEQNGRLLSFFSSENHHVVLKAKEILADRPHAHIMQAKSGFTPDESIMSTTAFMFGVFNSHITQGNTNFNILLSVCTSQFNTDPVSGQRIYVEIGGRRYLLGVPSAFEMGLNHCRWIYKFEGRVFQVRTWTSKITPQVNLDFKVMEGEKGRIIITHDFDPLNGWEVMPGDNKHEFIARPRSGSVIKGKFKNARFRMVFQSGAGFKTGGDELLYDRKTDGGSSLFVVEVDETREFSMSFIGEVVSKAEGIMIEDADQQFHTDCKVALTEWKDLSQNLLLKSEQENIAAIREILPWYGMNALVHYLTPYGLEQFGGAAWGTRDVSQGPVDLLLFMEKYDEAREVLRIIFSNQNPDGGWPQWWMFDSYSEIRSDSSHDDIYYWCLIALAGYIKVTGDYGFLGEVLPYYHEKGPGYAEKTPLSEHARRLITMVTGSFIPGTALVPFGGGDWNDSLQPVSKDLASRMISSWTVEMSYQAFTQYLQVYEKTGETERAEELGGICDRIKADFNRHLVKDGIVAGYGLVEADKSISVMLHPSDDKTGVHFSILPMERGILSGIFTKEQADYHQDIIEKRLKGPDGARLMDRPLKYKGGIQDIFQRAESSTFFGREIGLMYVHEHIRYAESLARTGKADAFVKALRQAIPVGYRDIVACGDIRQANCYYSSSDVHFRNRYEADERYDEVTAGAMTLRGGWRVYSSGPGIFIGIIVTRLLGLRIEYDNVIIDPVMPLSFDGLSVSMDFLDHQVTFKYQVKTGNFSPKSISINGNDVAFTLEENKYRRGGAVIPVAEFLEKMDQKVNLINLVL
jgi:1,2-beta-oligoglucan phosphorylase